jgi:hypothetical protein
MVDQGAYLYEVSGLHTHNSAREQVLPAPSPCCSTASGFPVDLHNTFKLTGQELVILFINRETPQEAVHRPKISWCRVRI